MSANSHLPQRRISSVSMLRWLVVGAYFSFFSRLLLLPDPLWLFRRLEPRARSWWDMDLLGTLSYAVHFGGFALLVLLLIWASPLRGTARYVWPAVAVALYSALIEFVQIPIPHRAFDLLDLAANSAGCAVAAGLGLLCRRRGQTTLSSAMR